MNEEMFGDKDLKCVVLCAGRGHRILPYSQEIPKVMIKIRDKPILGYVIDYWKKYTNDFIFVVGYKKEHIIDYVKKLAINSRFVEQKQLRGIANAVSYVKNLVSQKFIVVLGDCYYLGDFKFPGEMTQGIGVHKTDNYEYIKTNYSVEIKKDIVTQVVEKPKKIINDLCGMGVYFFDKKVFRYIERTAPSTLRNEIEITDVIQNMIKGGETIKPIFFNGYSLNITFPEDIKKAEELIFKKKEKNQMD